MFGGFKYCSYICTVNQTTNTMTEREDSQRYYESQLIGIDFHSEYSPKIKINGDKTDTKWMDLNEVSAEVIVRKLIKEFNLDIK